MRGKGTESENCCCPSQTLPCTRKNWKNLKGGMGQRIGEGVVRELHHCQALCEQCLILEVSFPPSTSSVPTHHLRSSSRLTSLCNSLLPLNSHLHCDPHHAGWHVVTNTRHHKGSHAALILFQSWNQGLRSFPNPHCIQHSAGLSKSS